MIIDDFEKIIDFYHATDHLSNAAEAIFGKGNPDGDTWYESKRHVLLEDVDGSEKVYRYFLYSATSILSSHPFRSTVHVNGILSILLNSFGTAKGFAPIFFALRIHKQSVHLAVDRSRVGVNSMQ